MLIEKVDTIERFVRMREEWNALLQGSASDSVFLTHEWLFTWWKHFSGTRRLSILTARDAGRLVGIMPMAERPTQYTRMIPRSLEFLGSGIIGSDYLDLFVAPDRRQEVLLRFSEYLSEAGLVLQLSHVRRDNCMASHLAAELQTKRWLTLQTTTNICPYIELRGYTWDAYMKTLGPSHRCNFNRRLRQLEQNFGARFECVRSPSESDRALKTVMQLHRKRWEPLGTSEAFNMDANVAFHREFVKIAAKRGWLRLLILHAAGKPAAALYGLRYGTTFYFYQSGFDPEFRGQSVGLVIMGLAIKTAIEEQASEYDLLHGDEEYKFRWASKAREVGRIELFPGVTRGYVCRNAIRFNRAAREMVRGIWKIKAG